MEEWGRPRAMSHVYICIYIHICMYVCVWRCVYMFRRAHVHHAYVYLYINDLLCFVFVVRLASQLERVG